MEKALELSDGNIRLWIDQECLHLKAVDIHGDPVEISINEARKLAEALLALTRLLELPTDASSGSKD